MQLKTLYTIFYLAVFMFIAKPFIGFSMVGFGSKVTESHSLLSKIFSKRKPEDLEDAKTKASAIKHNLTNPPETFFLTIAAILGLFFPITFKRDAFSSQSFLNTLRANLQPAEHPYLLTGKLTI